MDHALLIENYGCRDGELAEDSVAESSDESPLLRETLNLLPCLVRLDRNRFNWCSRGMEYESVRLGSHGGLRRSTS